MKPKIILALFAFVLILPIASSLEIENKNYEFQIVGSSVYIEETIDFIGSVTGAFSLSIPNDAEGISIYIDNEAADYINPIRLSSAKNIKVNYITNSVLDKSNFLASISSTHNITNLKITLTLEEGTSIRKEKEDGLSSPSVFPEPKEITSDGQSIILSWEKTDFTNKEAFPIYVRIKGKSSAAIIIIVLALVLAISYISVKQFLKAPKKQRKHEEKTEEKHEEKKEEKRDDLIEHLKEEEQQVVRILKSKEGSCEQGTLRIVTGFSKAHLSRLLSELEARKVIFKEKRGKKNLVFLK